MFDARLRIPCALEVRILRFIYENGPSSIDEFYEGSALRFEGHTRDAAFEGFQSASEKGFVAAVEGEPGSALRYHALINLSALRTLLIRLAVTTTFESPTEEFRQLTAEFLKLPRE